ncbi:hypothetical protein B0J18DRAFT_485802 [Chaetomium sp. MPI-SDFR-AT-0129]|nr:hypothetical protein B0J18DRAFT_485802 [Chaetomium sp. MPI-SDFR-AT-0129]
MRTHLAVILASSSISYRSVARRLVVRPPFKATDSAPDGGPDDGPDDGRDNGQGDGSDDSSIIFVSQKPAGQEGSSTPLPSQADDGDDMAGAENNVLEALAAWRPCTYTADDAER